MKITDPQPPASDPNVNDPSMSADDTDSTSTPNTDSENASPFSQLLAKKRESNQEGPPSKTAKQGETSADPFATLMPQQKAFDTGMKPSAVESKHLVTLPADLQQLVHEISVVANASGSHQVHIEMNSKVLKGLHIDIERRDGVMTVQFQSTSQEVTSLLSRNQAELVQGLAQRGMQNAEIRISGPRQSSAGAAGEKNKFDRSSGSWPSGRQGGKR